MPNKIIKIIISQTDLISISDSEIVTTVDALTPTRKSDDDQELESSINQENKFANSRFNQIGEGVDDDIAAAIQAISNAPLPVPITTTRYISKAEPTLKPRRKIVKTVQKTKSTTENVNQLEDEYPTGK